MILLHKTQIKVWKLPSTTGKLARNATNAGGVAFSISSKALVVPPPTIAATGFDKLLYAAGTPDEVVFGRVSIPTVNNIISHQVVNPHDPIM